MLGAKRGVRPGVLGIWVPPSPTPTETVAAMPSSSISTATAFPIRSSSKPPVGAIGVPTTNNMGLALLTLKLAGTGVGTPAAAVSAISAA